MPNLHLGLALDGAGWHPAAWREPDARPNDLLTARYWSDLTAEAERGLLDFVTIHDTLDAPPLRKDLVRGRLDAVLIAARIAPLTRHIGLIPVAVATHTEPFHLSKAIATLDYVSTGRAGVQITVSTESGHFGRRDLSASTEQELAAEAADYVEVLRRLWDSWEDDAEIRDAATGRFVDREKLHYIDFTGRWFSVKGPSITPRPPQGQPLIAATFQVGADLVFGGQFAELAVFLDDTEPAARDRRDRLNEITPPPGDIEVFAGTAQQLADHLVDRGAPGFRLHPAVLPHDLTAVTRDLVPELQRRGVFRREYEATTLRGLLGLSHPANRYALGSR
ncbi:LLM class flavin-dependent oxidoreductase [Pseudonocardiaceae bacterium YIM PH 21723]|nr:LLM class flavin-dependent oxidoreductase [Pseudonocardiaceae bacterium YIM PH 21723]